VRFARLAHGTGDHLVVLVLDDAEVFSPAFNEGRYFASFKADCLFNPCGCPACLAKG